MKTIFKNKSTTIIEDYLLRDSCIVQIIGDSNTITNVNCYISKTKKDAYDYACKSSYAFNGQCILVIHNENVNADYQVYSILNAGTKNASLDFKGSALLYRGNFVYRHSIEIGDLCTYDDIDYLYNGIIWTPITSIIDIDKINSPDDLIDAFDKLQKRAIEIGHPIKVFTKDPFTSSDVNLSLVYKNDNILASIKIDKTLEDIIGGKTNADS